MTTQQEQDRALVFNLVAHLHRQRKWSKETFGPGSRLDGVLDHIRKEIEEVRAKPTDLEEWIDLVLLSFDGAWRSGHSPEEIAESLNAKQTKNESRTWPDWRTAPPDQAIEHDKPTPTCHCGLTLTADSGVPDSMVCPKHGPNWTAADRIRELEGAFDVPGLTGVWHYHRRGVPEMWCATIVDEKGICDTMEFATPWEALAAAKALLGKE